MNPLCVGHLEADLLSITLATNSCSNHWLCAFRVFKQSPELDTVLVNSALLSLQQHWRLALQLVDDTDGTPDAYGATTVISACHEAWPMHLRWFRRWAAQGLEPTVGTLNSLMKVTPWTQAVGLLEACAACGRADAITINTMLATLAAEGLWMRSFTLLSACMSDSYSIAALADACGTMSRWQAALVKLEHGTHPRDKADVIAYNRVLEACADSEAWEVALQLLDSMFQHGPRPSPITSSSAMKSLKSQMWPLALGLLHQLRHHQLGHNEVLHTTCLQVLKSGGVPWTSALAVWAGPTGQITGHRPDAVSYRSIRASEVSWQHSLQLGEQQKAWMRLSEADLILNTHSCQSWEHALTTARRCSSDVDLAVLEALGSAGSTWMLVLTQWLRLQHQGGAGIQKPG